MNKFTVEKKVRDYIHDPGFKDCEILDSLEKKVIIEHFIDKLPYEYISKNTKKTTKQVEKIFTTSIKLISLYLNNKTPSLLVSDSKLSPMVKNALKDIEKIKCLKDLNNYTVEKLLTSHVGMNSILEIQQYIEPMGFSLKFSNQNCVHRLDTRFKKDLFSFFSAKHLNYWILSLSKLLREKL